MSLNNKYYEEKHYLKKGESSDKFDIVINESKCATFKNKNILCESCFNDAVIDKMKSLNSLERLNFINYQVNKYEDPLEWLIRTRAMLNDNEDEFGTHNYKAYSEFMHILESGIEQLSQKKIGKKTTTNNADFVNLNRIDELKSLNTNDFDFSKLIRYCEEINISHQNGSYFAVAMLSRAIIDHIPPIFNADTFANVYAQYGSKSFKEQMSHLDKSLRKIADSYLHTHIRKKETLPNSTQINFSPALDVLLAEICSYVK